MIVLGIETSCDETAAAVQFNHYDINQLLSDSWKGWPGIIHTSFVIAV